MPKKTWADVPIEYDGWMAIHDALRNFMKMIISGFDELLKHSANGKLENWHIQRFTKFYNDFSKLIHEHHDHEEHLFFPELNKRVSLPPKMTDDHKTLVANLNAVAEQIEILNKAQTAGERTAALQRGRELFLVFEEHCCPHLREEEEVALPLMRQNFTFHEIDAMVKGMLKTAAWYELPQVLFHMEQREKGKWMTINGVPGFVQFLIIRPRIKKYNKVFMQPYLSIFDDPAPVAAPYKTKAVASTAVATGEPVAPRKEVLVYTV